MPASRAATDGCHADQIFAGGAQRQDRPSGKPWITTLDLPVGRGSAAPTTSRSRTCPPARRAGRAATAAGRRNDGDFNDFVFYVNGLSCNVGGKPCTVADADRGSARAASPSAPRAGPPPPAARRSCRPPRSATRSTTTATAMVDEGDTSVRRARSAPRASASTPATTASSRARSADLRHRRAVQGSALHRHDVRRRPGLPRGHLRRRLRRRRLPARPGLPPGQLRRAVRRRHLSGGSRLRGRRLPAAVRRRAAAATPASVQHAAAADSGICFETGCENKTCAAGQVCKSPVPARTAARASPAPAARSA